MPLEPRHPSPRTKPQMVSQPSAQPELEIQELYELPQGELDLAMAKNLKLAQQLAQHCTEEMNQIKETKILNFPKD